MEIGMVGLGKMGMNLALNMLDHGVSVKAFDLSNSAVTQFLQIKSGTSAFTSLEELIDHLAKPRRIWVMVPAGKATDQVLGKLAQLLEPGDLVMDGGNSRYTDSIRHGQMLKKAELLFLDVGTSGGMEGARNGACLMVGGDRGAYELVEPILKAVTVEGGCLYTGSSGSGHYLKMVHNGIEYGMMQSLAEGFDVLDKGPFTYDNQAVAKVWSHGSVIRSWLVELLAEAFAKDANLDLISGVMDSSGEGKWTLEEALDLNAATPVIALSLMMRYRSLEADTFTGKVVAALRNEFGGHSVVKKVH